MPFQSLKGVLSGSPQSRKRYPGQGKHWKESEFLFHAALQSSQQPAALISFVTEVADLHNVTQKSKPHHCHPYPSGLGGEKTRTALWQTLRRHISMQMMMMSQAAPGNRKDKRVTLKPCQERAADSKKWGSCYVTGGGLEMKYEGNA